MICVFPVCAKDFHLLMDLLLWIKQLGGCKGHTALIVADGGLSFDDLLLANKRAKESFDDIDVVVLDHPVVGWIPGSNALWSAAANHLIESLRPWLFMEPDAVPLKCGWLDLLEADWKKLKTPNMGDIYQTQGVGEFPPTMISGVSVYDGVDPGVFDLSRKAFDVVISESEDFMRRCSHTDLIQHFWGQPGLPPTFREVKTPQSPINTFTMADIKPGAVVFHRNKDMTLIRMLRNRMGIKTTQRSAFITVLPVCNKDAELMIKCLDWMVEMEGNNGCDALISYDTSLLPSLRNRVVNMAAKAFANTSQYEYPRPPIEAWPEACNWAFQYTAKHIASRIRRPWFWMEADMVPLKPGWLKMLQEDFLNCGKPMYGPIVRPPGHINGTAIYPADFAEISPRAMNCTNLSWDTEMTPDTLDIRYDGSSLIQHAWGMVEGRLDETTGPAAHFAAVELVERWIRPEAVIFHRCKDGSLIDRLREMKR